MYAAVALALICAWLVRPARSRRLTGSRPLFKGTGGHWRRNHSRRSFLRLGAGVAAAGLLAYSGVDEALEAFHRSRIRSPLTDRAAGGLKFFGERFWFVSWALVAVSDGWLRTNPFSRWGRANFEAMVVGLPTLWTVQRGLGANRPSSREASPRWRPLAADNSASGHTFMAAVPWLTLARRSAPGAWPGLARAASVLTGWSRLNDRKHYLSQVILGWVIAWNAVSAVDGDTAAAFAEGDKHAEQENRMVD